MNNLKSLILRTANITGVHIVRGDKSHGHEIMLTSFKHRIATAAITATLAATFAVGLSSGIADAAQACATGRHFPEVVITH